MFKLLRIYWWARAGICIENLGINFRRRKPADIPSTTAANSRSTFRNPRIKTTQSSITRRSPWFPSLAVSPSWMTRLVGMRKTRSRMMPLKINLMRRSIKLTRLRTTWYTRVSIRPTRAFSLKHKPKTLLTTSSSTSGRAITNSSVRQSSPTSAFPTEAAANSI